MMRCRISTPTNPTTEITVSMIDQVLIVWPTLIPKYSLTSQNPASFTCEKNSDPRSMVAVRHGEPEPAAC